MEALYHQTNKLVQETQHLFSQLDRRLPNLNLNVVESDIIAKINLINSLNIPMPTLSKKLIQKYSSTLVCVTKLFVDCIKCIFRYSNCERLDILYMKGPLLQRQNSKMRVDQLKYDSRHLSAALKSWKNQQIRRQQEENEREALLACEFTTNDHIDILIDQSLDHNNRVRNANEGVNNLLQHGSGILENLRSQRLTLKGAHRRLVDIGNALGLSNTTMRLIETRARQDGFILVGGILFTCFVITLIIIYMT